jgi:uncharacterized SAM-binding protein YcdF (DUF218 family)
VAGAHPRAYPADALRAPLQAIVVLGCRVVLDGGGRLVPGALRRRVERGAEAYFTRGDAATVVVVSGGRHWAVDANADANAVTCELVEADAMARELVARGVPEGAIARERCSLSTRDNARFSAETLGRRGIARAGVVTCSWHLHRALALFAREGIDAEGIAARDGQTPRWTSRVWRWGVERVLTQV